MNSMIFGYGLLLLMVLTLGYAYYKLYYTDSDKEGFYPRHWWGPGWRWGWRRPWLQGWGNWRPYGYYPAYSGYWKQCPNGTWCPMTASCNSLACST